MLYDLVLGVVLSLVLGFLVGIQREAKLQHENEIDFAGFRSFALVSLFGFLVGFLSNEILKNIYFLLIGFAGIILLSVLAYIFSLKVHPKKVSITAEMSLILMFLAGVLISFGYYHIAISLTIVLSIILYLGEYLHKFAKQLKEVEVVASLKFAIISFVVLPLLPNKDYALTDFPYMENMLSSQSLISVEMLAQLNIFNPYYIWLMVVFISGISFVGYILIRAVGANKGLLLTGALGGLASSTAVMSSFAIESKRSKNLAMPFVIGALVASSIMFFRVIFEVLVLNPALFSSVVVVFGVMGITGIILSIVLLKKYSNSTKPGELKVSSPFTFGPAIKFTLFFVMVLFISKFANIVFGNSGNYLIAFISGFVDVDAITITMANLSKAGEISNQAATISIMIAAFSNTIFKAGIAYYFGSKNFFKGIVLCFLAIIIIGLIALFF